MSLLSACPGSIAQGLIWGIFAIGVYMTYRILDIADLTVDGSIATGGAVAAVCIINGVHPILALLLAFIAGMAAGTITGLLHTGLGIPAILSGILTQLALYSLNMRIMGKSNTSVSVDKYDLVVSLRHIPNSIIIGAVLCIVLIAILYYFFGTELGCSLRATGCNPNMARAQGINTNKNKILGLAMSNGLVGLAGGLYAQYQGNADVNMGRGAIVIGLAAVIIGEVLREAIMGKRFNFAAKLVFAVVGAIIYYIVIAIVLWLGFSSNDLKLFSAIIVAIFLAVPYIKKTYFKKIPNKKAIKDEGAEICSK